MATIDPSIPLGVKPVQLESPLNALMQIGQLQGVQQQNALLGLKMQQAQREQADLQALRSGLSAPDADPYKVLLQAGKVKEATEYQAGQRANDKAQVELVDAKLKQSREMLTGVQTPEQFIAWHQANHADPVLGPMLKARGITPETSMQRIQTALQTPGGFQQLLQESALGLQKFTELNKPTTHFANTGGTTQVVQTPGLGGAPQLVGSMQNTQDPNSVASVAATLRGQNLLDDRARAQLAQSERHFQISQANERSKPFEVTGPDGQAVLVQQDKAGNLVPVQGYAPKGGGKPLPGAALKQITEVRDSANTIDRLATSFKPDYAGKGLLGFGADTQLGAAGVLGKDQDAVEWWKNYRKQAELVERHAMFGAALTPGEQASWRNADIGPGMDAKTIQRNLRTRQELAARMLDTTRQDLIDAGHSEQRVNAIAGRGPAGAAGSQPAKTDPGIDALLKKYGGK